MSNSSEKPPVKIQAGDDNTIIVGIGNTINKDNKQYDVSGLSNPYLGLRSFTYKDEDIAIYAGRDSDIEKAKKKLAESRNVLLFITGASGSGKSSLAQAGIVPALEAHYKTFGTTTPLPYSTFTPSAQPLSELSTAMKKILQLGIDSFPINTNDPPQKLYDTLREHARQKNSVIILVIDQFEELFTQSQNDQRDALLKLLENLPPFDDIRTHIIVTLRSDYVDTLQKQATLQHLMRRWDEIYIELEAMEKGGLEKAIQQPLLHKQKTDESYRGKQFEPALLERLVQDAKGDATLLPLLQQTLKQLWKDKKHLTLENYGKLGDAIQEHADSVCTKGKSEDDKKIIQDILLDLIEVSHDDRPERDARKGRTKHELTEGKTKQDEFVAMLRDERCQITALCRSKKPHILLDISVFGINAPMMTS